MGSITSSLPSRVAKGKVGFASMVNVGVGREGQFGTNANANGYLVWESIPTVKVYVSGGAVEKEIEVTTH